jgi:hypothetical protein
LYNTTITINGYIKNIFNIKLVNKPFPSTMFLNSILHSVFFILLISLKVASALPNIKLVVFKTGAETAEQLALLPRVQVVASHYGANGVEEHDLPSTPTYTHGTQTLHATWYKMQVTREIMDTNPQVDFVLTFELSALPTDGSAAIDFAALVHENPKVSVFLKRVGAGFGMAMYKNDIETRRVVDNIWAKRSAGSSVSAAFGSYTFWNPLILTKVKFL